MYERFSDRARKVMQLANQEAAEYNQESVDAEYILLGLAREGDGVACHALRYLNVEPGAVAQEVRSRLSSQVHLTTVMGKLPQTPRAKKIIERALEAARDLSHNYVGTEHLLLGLLALPDGVAVEALKKFGLTYEGVRKEVLAMLGHSPVNPPLPPQGRLVYPQQTGKSTAYWVAENSLATISVGAENPASPEELERIRAYCGTPGLFLQAVGCAVKECSDTPPVPPRCVRVRMTVEVGSEILYPTPQLPGRSVPLLAGYRRNSQKFTIAPDGRSYTIEVEDELIVHPPAPPDAESPLKGLSLSMDEYKMIEKSRQYKMPQAEPPPEEKKSSQRGYEFL